MIEHLETVALDHSTRWWTDGGDRHTLAVSWAEEVSSRALLADVVRTLAFADFWVEFLTTRAGLLFTAALT